MDFLTCPGTSNSLTFPCFQVFSAVAILFTSKQHAHFLGFFPLLLQGFLWFSFLPGVLIIRLTLLYHSLPKCLNLPWFVLQNIFLVFCTFFYEEAPFLSFVKNLREGLCISCICNPFFNSKMSIFSQNVSSPLSCVRRFGETPGARLDCSLCAGAVGGGGYLHRCST